MDDEEKIRRFEQAIYDVVSAIVGGFSMLAGGLLWVAGAIVFSALLSVAPSPWSVVVWMLWMLPAFAIMISGANQIKRIYECGLRRY